MESFGTSILTMIIEEQFGELGHKICKVLFEKGPSKFRSLKAELKITN